MNRHLRRRPIRRRTAIASIAFLAITLMTALITRAEAAGTITIKAGADSYVRADQPDANFGSKFVLDTQAAADGSPLQLSYLRFEVTGLTQAASKVNLRLFTYSAASTGLQVWSAPSTWTEAGITYTNSPLRNPVMVGAIPTISSNTWAELDVSNVVTGNGSYTFVISTTATTNKSFASRESTTSTPELVLTTNGTPASVAASAGAGQITPAGTAFATPLAASVTDASGAGVANVAVTFTAPASGPSGTFAGGSSAVSVTTGANGVATAPSFTANASTGSYLVTAAAAGLTSTTTFALTNGAATAPTTTTPTTTTPTTTTTTSAAAPSGTAPTSAPGTTTTQSFALSADTYVRSDLPDTNFGAKFNLAAEAGSATTPTITSYVTVQVKGLTASVQSATLQLFSYATSALGIKVWNTASGWTETGLTYTSAPLLGTAAGSGPNIAVNTWASVDLGSAITGNGTFSFAITTTRTANNQFGSRESGTPPKVVVVTTTTTATTPPPTSTPTPTTSPAAPTSTSVVATGGAVQSAMVGTNFAAPLAALVRDASSRAVAGVNVTFTAPATAASATFPGGSNTVTITTGANGVATSPPIAASGSAGTYSVTATVPGQTASASFTLTNTDPRIVAAGDIACSATTTPSASACQQLATSNLAIGLSPNYVLPLGDDQYELGSLSDYQQMYDPSWGRLNSISYPVPGNHEYGYIGTAVEPTGGAGYFGYFGDRSHPLDPGCSTLCKSWYSYNIGSWHVVALDSQCAVIGGCNPGNPEYAWLQADLKANPTKCTLAYWHIPVFSSSQDHQPDMQAIYSLLYTKGADVVLNGHAHFYERFDPQDSTGVATATGPREFIVGSGGRSFFAIRQVPAANSASRIANTFGVLQMTLSSGSYSWRFVAANGATATDSGSAACV